MRICQRLAYPIHCPQVIDFLNASDSCIKLDGNGTNGYYGESRGFDGLNWVRAVKRKPRRITVDRDHYKKWKAGFLPTLPRTGKAILENSQPADIAPTNPQPLWLFKNWHIFRLCFDCPSPKLEWNPAYLAKKIRDDSPPNTVFFADTGFFTKPVDFAVWDAILSRRLAITPRVWTELQDWLVNPFCNGEVRDLIKHAYDKGLGTFEVVELDEVLRSHGYDYYLKLVSYRKLVWKELREQFRKDHSRDPSETELTHLVQKRCGDGSVVAIKGWKDRHKANLLADEELVVSAALTSILRGVEVVILSRDNDLQSQFVTLTSLLSRHYLSMLAGDHFSGDAEYYREHLTPHFPCPDAELFEDEKIVALKFPLNELDIIKPTNVIPVLMHCLVFSGSVFDRKFSAWSFCGETEMRRMLAMKSATQGLSTNKFGVLPARLPDSVWLIW